MIGGPPPSHFPKRKVSCPALAGVVPVTMPCAAGQPLLLFLIVNIDWHYCLFVPVFAETIYDHACTHTHTSSLQPWMCKRFEPTSRR